MNSSSIPHSHILPTSNTEKIRDFPVSEQLTEQPMEQANQLDAQVISSAPAVSADTSTSPSLETAGDSFEGRFLHACPMTGKTVDEFDDEIVHCRCYESADFLEVQDNRAVLMDAKR
jgi:hypothetical protein